MMDVTALRDGVRVVVGGGAAFGGEDLGERRGARDHGGRAACQSFQSGQPERLVRAGGQRDVGGRQDGGDGVAAPDVAGEVDGQARGLAFEPGAHRTFADHDQSGVNARVSQCGNGIDTSVRMLLHRQPAAVHQQGLFRAAPTVAAPTRTACWDGTGRGRRPSGTVSTFEAWMRSNSSRANAVVHTTAS